MDFKWLSHYLLEPDYWPAIVTNSSHMPLLNEIVSFSLDLEQYTEGSAEIDSTLHRLLHGCCLIAYWLPKPNKKHAPHYTRTKWDLRALSALVPAGMDVKLDGESEAPDSSHVTWQANLHDRFNANLVDYSDLEHQNAALSNNGGMYSSSWTPNLAMARILLAAYLLASIQMIMGRALPVPMSVKKLLKSATVRRLIANSSTR